MYSFEEAIKKDKEHHSQVLASGYDGCDIVVMSQAEVKEYIPETDNEVCISISNEYWGEYKPILSEKYKEILQVEFDDVAVGDAGRENIHNVSDHQAQQIVMFFDRYYQTAHKIVIHCFGGISRSRSTASALCTCFGLPFRYTALNKPVENQITKAYHSLMV